RHAGGSSCRGRSGGPASPRLMHELEFRSPMLTSRRGRVESGAAAGRAVAGPVLHPWKISMPELPEVETTCRGIRPHVEGRTLTRLAVRNPRLRVPVPEGLEQLLAGQALRAVE